MRLYKQIVHCKGVPFFCFEKELLGPYAIMAQAFEHLKWQSRLMLLASLKEPYNGAAAPWTRKLCRRLRLALQTKTLRQAEVLLRELRSEPQNGRLQVAMIEFQASA